MRSCDGVIHLAGSYRIGIPARERPQMYEANVGATHRVLEAAIATGVPRIVHVSSVNALGNTHEKIVDETYRRDISQGFLSYYDETKHLAHVAARELISSGAPVLIAMPGTTLRSRRSFRHWQPVAAGVRGPPAGHRHDRCRHLTGACRRRRGRHHRHVGAGPDRRVVHPGRTQHALARGAGGRGPGRRPSAARASPCRPVCSARSPASGPSDRSSSANRRTSPKSSARPTT